LKTREMEIVVQLRQVHRWIIEVNVVVVEAFQVRADIVTAAHCNHTAKQIRMLEIRIGREKGAEAGASRQRPRVIRSGILTD